MYLADINARLTSLPSAKMTLANKNLARRTRTRLIKPAVCVCVHTRTRVCTFQQWLANKQNTVYSGLL